MFGRHWFPVSDLAIFDMSVRDVWTAHPPLTGLWSRPGWSHPGPLAYWLVALFSGPLGSPAVGHAGRRRARRRRRDRLAGLDHVEARAAARCSRRRRSRASPTSPRARGSSASRGTSTSRCRSSCSSCSSRSSSPRVRPRLFIAMAFVGSLIVQTHVGYAVLVADRTRLGDGVDVVDARRVRTRAGPLALDPRVISRARAGRGVDPADRRHVRPLARQPPRPIVGYFAAGDYPHVGLDRAAGIFAERVPLRPADARRPRPPERLPRLRAQSVRAGLAGRARRPARRRVRRRPVVPAAGGLRRVGLAVLLTVVAVLAISRADEPRGVHVPVARRDRRVRRRREPVGRRRRRRPVPPRRRARRRRRLARGVDRVGGDQPERLGRVARPAGRPKPARRRSAR